MDQNKWVPFIFLLGSTMPMLGCGWFGSENNHSGKPSDLIESKSPHLLFVRDTNYAVRYRSKSIEIRYKVSNCASDTINRKLLLLLPGWNYADTQWFTRTEVCSTALARGYDLMFVEMGKSVYMDSLYPQMRNDYREYPTRTWLWDSVLRPLQFRGYFTQIGIPEDPIQTGSGKVLYKSLRLPMPCYVMGLSTGARGAVLLAMEHGEAFRGCAGLSGDYDPTLQPTDNLMINCLGAMNQNNWRWRGSNNLVLRARELRVSCFLAHGGADRMVAVTQSRAMYDALQKSNSLNDQGESRKLGPQFKYVEILRAEHDYKFWSDAGIQALNFFKKLESFDQYQNK